MKINGIAIDFYFMSIKKNGGSSSHLTSETPLHGNRLLACSAKNSIENTMLVN